jgi:SPP1 family predicted phage head-tail adaptor
MRAGDLRNLISIQSYTETRSASGAVTKTWTTYVSVWAKFRTLSGNERIAAQQASSVLTHEVSIRYLDFVKPGDRISWGTRVFDIKDVRNFDELNVETRMLCSEVLASGPASSQSPSVSVSGSVSASPSASAST